VYRKDARQERATSAGTMLATSQTCPPAIEVRGQETISAVPRSSRLPPEPRTAVADFVEECSACTGFAAYFVWGVLEAGRAARAVHSAQDGLLPVNLE
jgi:hypothetical protein